MKPDVSQLVDTPARPASNSTRELLDSVSFQLTRTKAVLNQAEKGSDKVESQIGRKENTLQEELDFREHFRNLLSLAGELRTATTQLQSCLNELDKCSLERKQPPANLRSQIFELIPQAGILRRTFENLVIEQSAKKSKSSTSKTSQPEVKQSRVPSEYSKQLRELGVIKTIELWRKFIETTGNNRQPNSSNSGLEGSLATRIKRYRARLILTASIARGTRSATADQCLPIDAARQLLQAGIPLWRTADGALEAPKKTLGELEEIYAGKHPPVKARIGSHSTAGMAA